MDRLKASTLVEATVAMTLLTIIMGIAWLTFEQILNNQQSAQALHAQLLLKEHARQVQAQQAYYDTEWDSLGYRIIQRVEWGQECQVLHLRCETPTGAVFTYQSILAP